MANTITRVIYFSENQLDPTGGSVLQQLSEILSASNRNNQPAGLTGALVFDNQWFLQVLEGERAKVWQTLRRIEDDDRHANVVIVEAGEVPARIFGNWWMGIATRNTATEVAFAPYLQNGLLRPQDMTAAAMMALMISLSKIGLSRQLAAAA